MLSPLEMATLLLKTGCVQVNAKEPFTYASGLKGPIYCDNRLLLGQVEARRQVVASLVEITRKESMDFDAIAGLATAGIPYAAWMAEILEKPMLYIRGKKKDHGKSRQVEGPFNLGSKALLVEDLVNQASSLEDATLGARGEGLVVSDVLCLVDYQMKTARERVERLSLNLISLTKFEMILEAAGNLGLLNDSEQKLLRSWQENPAQWRS